MENVYVLTADGELYHHGIKGMKWGFRRYQNPDGSLTPAGKKRYDEEIKKVKAETSKVKAEQRAQKRTIAKAEKLNQVKKELTDLKESGKQLTKETKAVVSGKPVKDDKDKKPEKSEKTEKPEKNETKPPETDAEKKARLLREPNAKEILENRRLFTDNELSAVKLRMDTERNISSFIPAEVNPHKAKMDKIMATIGDATDYAVTAAKAWNMTANVLNALGITEVSLPKVDTEITKGNKETRRQEKKKLEEAAAELKKKEQETEEAALKAKVAKAEADEKVAKAEANVKAAKAEADAKEAEANTAKRKAELDAKQNELDSTMSRRAKKQAERDAKQAKREAEKEAKKAKEAAAKAEEDAKRAKAQAEKEAERQAAAEKAAKEASEKAAKEEMRRYNEYQENYKNSIDIDGSGRSSQSYRNNSGERTQVNPNETRTMSVYNSPVTSISASTTSRGRSYVNDSSETYKTSSSVISKIRAMTSSGNKSYSDIADDLGVSVSTVQNYSRGKSAADKIMTYDEDGNFLGYWSAIRDDD